MHVHCERGHAFVVADGSFGRSVTCPLCHVSFVASEDALRGEEAAQVRERLAECRRENRAETARRVFSWLCGLLVCAAMGFGAVVYVAFERREVETWMFVAGPAGMAGLWVLATILPSFPGRRRRDRSDDERRE